jgi:hypothetical protein
MPYHIDLIDVLAQVRLTSRRLTMIIQQGTRPSSPTTATTTNL